MNKIVLVVLHEQYSNSGVNQRVHTKEFQNLSDMKEYIELLRASCDIEDTYTFRIQGQYEHKVQYAVDVEVDGTVVTLAAETLDGLRDDIQLLRVDCPGANIECGLIRKYQLQGYIDDNGDEYSV